MNSETNKFEHLHMELEPGSPLEKALEELGNPLVKPSELLRPNGEPIPKHWSIFKVGELVNIKNYTFKIAYIGETSILFEPVKPVIVGETS